VNPGLDDADSDWRWLSPRSLIVRPVTDLIRLLPVLLGLLFFGSSRGGGSYWGFGFAAVAIVTSMVRWSTTRYRITPERIYLRRGLLNQKVLSVPRDRIRSVDLSAHVVYRVLGLRKVMVGTGRNDRREGESVHLDALRLLDAEALRATLLTGPVLTGSAVTGAAGAGVAGAGVSPAPSGPGVVAAAGVPGVFGVSGRSRVSGAAEPAERELARLAPGWVRFAPLTLTGLVIVGVVIGSGTQVIDATHIDVTRIGTVHRLAIRFGALAPPQQVLDGALAVLVLLVLLSVAGYVALFWNFRLVRQSSGVLRVSRGLLSTRTTTIDTRRLRGAELSEPLLLRAAGGARCLAITTGLRVGRGAERGGSLLLPPAPRRVASEVAAAVLSIPAELLTGDLIRHGRAARRRRHVRALAGACAVVLILAVVWLTGHAPAWPWLSSLVLLPLAAALAADRYRSLGHRLAGDWLITRTGSLVRRRSVLSTDGIIGWRIHQSWFQRRQCLVSLAATTAAGRQDYVAHDIPVAAALALAAAATSDLMTPFLRDADGA
jgi:putative membrane protein